ncbi:MAG: 5'-methylthioadenosine/S-adenosylhomocysteine nucleosidase [Desulfuromonadaceae bacterium]|nr:5'-methylthioadenosine/S-adenosylhomocysteine nucleosidase [Desulfuromonadaceae bacterium]
MNIAFIAAMPEEFRAVACHLDTPETVRIGQYKGCSGTASGHNIVVLESGMGFDNATRGTRTLLNEIRPDILVSTGFCGGIAPNLVVGDVVLATRIVIVSGDLIDEVPAQFAAAGLNFVERHSISDRLVFGGLFVSTPGIMEKPRIAALLPTSALNPVVEMESAAIALIAAENGIPFVGIRSVSDPAGEELRFSLDEFCDNQMRISIPRVLLTILRKPRIIPQLVRLGRNSSIAGARLAHVIKQFLNFI